MRFSLVMCTLGRRHEIAAFFDSLLAGGTPDCEVIVVDQNVDDRLVPIVEKYASRVPIKHVRMTGTGLSRARNLGLKHVTGELIGFPDDDCEYLAGTLDRVATLFAHEPSIDAITGYPTDERTRSIGDDWRSVERPLDRFSVLNRCQEFTIFLRASALGDVRFTDELGVGSNTPWGADEGPDFLIRLVNAGRRLVYFPKLFVYHPNKILEVNAKTLQRAASYARGRGALFRIHRFPLGDVARGLVRPAGGAVVYSLRLQPKRARYYATIAANTLRGLAMRRRDVSRLRVGSPPVVDAIAPMPLPPLADRPLVSVLVTNFNYARFLPAMLDSLVAQTYAKWEAVVCDDGSTDDSVAIVRRYAARDARIRLVEKPNGGQTSTFNECHRHLRGEIVCPLDADDRFAPAKLARVVETLRAGDAGVCIHFANVIDADDRVLPGTFNARLDDGWLAPGATARGACVYVPVTSCQAFRREVLDVLMPIPADQRRDVDGYLGMAAQFLTPFARVDERLADYRVHGTNMGGMTVPTPPRLRYELTLIAERTATLRRFLATRFGESLASRIRLIDNPQYVQAALKMLAIGGPAERALVDVEARSLIAHHPSGKWRAMWRAILALPAPLRRRVVPALHNSHRLKAIAQRLMTRGERPADREAAPPRAALAGAPR